MKWMLTICLTLLSLAVSHAKGNIFDSIPEKKDTSITEKFAIYYRFDESEFDQTYLTNSETAAHIKNYLINSPRIDSITIYAWASPEGAYLHNVKLSQRRARTAKRFLLSHAPDSTKLNADKIKISPLAENWQGLEAMVVEKYRRHDREKVITILRDRTIGDETRKWRLQQLDGGYTWRYMLRNYMPQLRAATWICVWAEVIEPLPAVDAMTVEAAALTEAAPVRESAPVVETQAFARTIAALKTNLLYDAVTGLNAELEIPIGDRWSVAVEDVFPWWSWGPNKNKYAFQMWEIGIEPRWWFRRTDARDRLSGHFIGAYAMSGIYDFQNDSKICYQGEAWSAGLSYGYAMKLGKSPLNLEFAVSVGYLTATYRHYSPSIDYDSLIADLYESGKTHYFGPTKAKVSLVLPIGIRYNKKGGER